MLAAPPSSELALYSGQGGGEARQSSRRRAQSQPASRPQQSGGGGGGGGGGGRPRFEDDRPPAGRQDRGKPRGRAASPPRPKGRQPPLGEKKEKYFTTEEAGVDKNTCIRCGSNSHYMQSPNCEFAGQDLPPSKCGICGRGAHWQKFCRTRGGPQPTPTTNPPPQGGGGRGRQSGNRGRGDGDAFSLCLAPARTGSNTCAAA
jgi:hypothetical protein